MYEQFVSIPSDEVEWEDGEGTLLLPSGVQVKIFQRDDSDNDRMDFLVKFPPGYSEPEHFHAGLHFGLILEGKQEVGGRTFGPGTYVYAPPHVMHGPFHYPEGCTLFGSMAGGPAHLYKDEEGQ
jgi:anti-sigma factor ChrR (cupin superfamily)